MLNLHSIDAWKYIDFVLSLAQVYLFTFLVCSTKPLHLKWVFFIMILLSALMTRAFTISIKATVWIRTRHLPLSVQWPVSSTKGKMRSFCAKNFWCKTLTKQDYEPGDQRLSMYLLISNSENYYWFFGLIVKSLHFIDAWKYIDFVLILAQVYLLPFLVCSTIPLHLKWGFFIMIPWSALITGHLPSQ